MNNQTVKSNLDDCKQELNNISNLCTLMGMSSNVIPYLTNYTIIKACGSIERAFKDIISDYCINNTTSLEVRNYIEKTFRESSMNPNLSNICKSLNNLNPTWKTNFNSQLNANTNAARYKSSISSLVESRNNFAHGNNPTASIQNVVTYFDDSYEIMKILDNIVN